ncbi:MAG: hypothetical protein ACT4PE_16805, partial [Candidatus Eiseniibacteriota bacterium]
MDERHLDVLPERVQRVAKNVRQSDGLEEQAAKVGEDGAPGVGLVVDLSTLAAIAEDAGRDER